MQRHPSLPSFEWAGSSNRNVAVSGQCPGWEQILCLFLQSWLIPCSPSCTTPGTQPGGLKANWASAVLHQTESWNEGSGTDHKLSVGNICINVVFNFSSKIYYPEMGVMSNFFFLIIISRIISCATRDKHAVTSFKITIIISHTRQRCHTAEKTLKFPDILIFQSSVWPWNIFFCSEF